MGSFDLFHEAADRTSVSQTRTSGTISGATWLYPEGAAFTLSSAPATPFAEGMRVQIYDNVLGIASCVVKKVTSTTNITLLPVQSAADTVPLPYQFPNGSTILVSDELAAQQVIDLSEAPDDSYDFVVIGNGTVETSGAPADVDTYMRLGAFQDDPFSGVSGFGAAKLTLSSANPDRVNFVAASKITLLGGQRYENFLAFTGPSTAGVITTVTNPRLLALRVTGGYFAGDGKTAVGNTNSTSFVDYLDLGADLPAGQYLIVSAWALGSTAAGAYADAVLEMDASTVLAQQLSLTPATNNYIPAGFFGVVTLGATNRVRLRYKGNLGFNASIKNAFLAAIPIANIPAFAGVHVSQDLATDVSASVDTTFATMKTSDSVTLETGRHIEVISASVGGAAAFRARPNFGGAGTGLGNDNLPPFGPHVNAYHPTFWFVRNRRTAGATTSAIEMRSQSGSATLKARDFTFSWLREQPDFVAQPDEPVAIIADVELGGQVLKRWNSTTTTRRYSHRMEGERAFSRARVNGEDYLRVYSLSAMDAVHTAGVVGTWFWDPLTMDVYVQLTTAHAALGAPDSTAVNIVVVPLLLAGLEKRFVLTDVIGNRWPYRPLLEAAPKLTETLDSDDATFAASASLGSLEIVNAHGEFDDTLFRGPMQSYRVKVRRGFPRKSSRIEDFEVMADAVIRRPGRNLETLRMQLLDRRRLLQTPVAKTKITVREGYGSDKRTRDDQDLPVVWGETLGLTAYRITDLEGASDWNEYRFCDHAVKSVTNVWIDTERRKAVSAGNRDVTATYIGNGRVRVNNAAFAAPTQPPDVVYVDLSAGRTSDGTTSGVALHRLGEIARNLVTVDGGTPAVRLVERTFRMIDRRWRYQQVPGVGRRPVAPRISFVVSGNTTVEQALTQLCAQNFAYWYVNHQDRIALDVPDFDRGNLVRNGGFEDDSSTAFPWRTIDGATLGLTTVRKYAGARSAEISNGSPTNSVAAAVQHLTLPAGGTHVVTLVASLLEGVADKFRIGVVGPSGNETLSEPMTLGTGRWSRHSLAYDAEPGDSGFAELRLYPAHGSTTDTRIAVDEVHAYRVACVTDRVKSEPVDIELEDERYYECDVPWGVNRQASQVSKRRINESEARGLSAAIEPEGKYAVQDSTRAELSDTHAADADSAGGLGGPVALYYSRERPVMTINVEGLERIPLLGDYVYHRNNPRIPESPDEFPIWRTSKVETDDESGKAVQLQVKRQLDPVADRIDIAPDNVPMGASAPTLSTSVITDYAEVETLRDQYIMGARKPDTTTQRGDLYHRHSLEHAHPIASHAHTVTPTSHGIDAAGAAGEPWPVKFDGPYGYPAPVGPQEPVLVSRGLTDGGHAHGVPGPNASGATSGTSSPPNATIETAPGPNDPSYRRVRIMQRIAATVDTIDANLIVGFLTLPLPAGWTRVTALDGLYLRGATPNVAVSTTVATSTFTPSDSGSILKVASATNISVGKRLRVRRTDDGDKQVHVVVTAIAGTDLTVVPLHETTDQPNTYTFPAGANSTVVGDSEVANTAFTAPTHKHDGTMPSHQHTGGGHQHLAASFVLGGASNSLQAQKYLGGTSEDVGDAAHGEHTHESLIAPPADNTNSSSAGGTVTGDVTPVLPFYEVIWAVSDGSHKTVPAGGILMWTASNDPPPSWKRLGAAKDLFLKGATTGAAATSGVGGHVHQQADTAHTMSHAHGGTAIQPSDAPDGETPLIDSKIGAATRSVAAGHISTGGGHAHQVTATIAAVDPGLSANAAHDTGPALLGLPRHKTVMLIQKS